MIKLNMSDVISVLKSCSAYLYTLLAILVFTLVAAIAVQKIHQPVRKLIRSQAWVAAIASIAVITTLICVGPMRSLISLSTGGSGTISEQTTKTSLKDGKQIADEGIILLKNDANTLPLKDKKINIFGWTSANPVYGGSGAGALNDLYHKTNILEGLKNAGISYNEDITKLYTGSKLSRGTYGTDWNLPEIPVKNYSDSLMSAAQNYSHTAMVVIGRTGGEGQDLPKDMSEAKYQQNSKDYKDFKDGESYLDLSQTEKDLLSMVNSKFDNVIVVYDGLSAMPMGFIKNYSNVKSLIWCPGAGQSGFTSLGEVLTGAVNPSGKTVDTLVYDVKKTPSYNNFGGFSYTNMNEFQVDKADPYMGGSVPAFVNIVEGIYVGYKYFETAYQEKAIDYDATVQFPFGYGLSYTRFKQELKKGETLPNGKIQLTVSVTNTGKVAGKDTVQVYYNPPYTNGEIEKSAVNLIEFGKTKLLEPSESQTLTITVDPEDMASYDYKDAKAYVLEAGDYTLSINENAHKQIESYKYTVGKTVIYSGDKTHNGDKQVATNLFDQAASDVTYLSRKDHFANYDKATAAPSSMKISAKDKANFIATKNYKATPDKSAKMPTTGAKNGVKLAQLRGKAYDDKLWDSLLDELTIKDMNELIAHGGFQTAAVSSVGKIRTLDSDGPSAVSNNFTKAGSVGFPTAVMIAATWNKDLAQKYGQDMAKMAIELGSTGWYAPSANLHRNPLAGRTYEYFSEDSYMSAVMTTQTVKGSNSEGVYAYIKHFAMNEQETNRWSMLCTWVNEQAIRETYLKPFEMAVKEGHAKAVMSSFNYIGGVWAGGYKNLLTEVLRNEWGFKGAVVSDYFAGAYFMNSDQMTEAGGDFALSTFDIGTNFVGDTKSAASLTNMRRAAHDILYMTVNSHAYEGNVDTGLENWEKILIAINTVIALLIICIETVAIRRFLKRRKQAKGEMTAEKTEE